MGMAASQARLLTITARMHDIEYQAQSIQNAKIALATQSDQVYQDYVAALDEQTLTVKDWQGNVISANFNNLCGINAVDSNYTYALMDSKGRLIVDRGIAEQYNKFMEETDKKGDAYAFAYYMLGVDENSVAISAKTVNERYNAAIKSQQDNQNGDGTTVDQDLRTLWKTIENEAKDSNYKIDPETGRYVYVKPDGASSLCKTDKDKDLDALLEKYYFMLNKRHSEDLFKEVCTETNKNGTVVNPLFEYFDEDDFNYYVNIFKQIQANGGSCVSIANCVSVSDYDGFDGDAANDGDWLRDMIQSGKITVEHVNVDKKNGRVSFASTSVPSDSILEYTATSTVDSAKLAKVQAEYEHKTKELDRKDKKFDLDLSKLDTQRTALKTEYESVKKVISENIDRTFGIFS